MKQLFSIFIFFVLCIACNEIPIKEKSKLIQKSTKVHSTSLIILGTTQDAGSPHMGCKKDCCKKLFESGDKSREVVSLGIIDTENKKTYIFEATPDFPSQMKNLNSFCPFETKEIPDGIFLTHAHIGHYSGLMYLGKEGMNADTVNVYAMPRMKEFLENNGPWSQLVNKRNISIKEITEFVSEKVSFGFIVKLNPQVRVVALKVPHRDEFSETVGYLISGPNKKVLFIPDIDKWEKWDKNIIDMISQVDFAFIDGTFFDGEEIKSRNIKEIPHPFVIESMELFKNLPAKEKAKIHFIHYNHTNPLLDSASKQYKLVIKNGFKVAQKNMGFEL